MNPFAVEAKIKDLADRAATEFLQPLSEKRASPDYISKNAEKILKEAGASLTSVVVKLAREENLNPHEVARVCEESNKEVFGRLYKGSEDKTFEFSVADARGALAELDRPYEGPGDIFLPVDHPKHAALEKDAAAHRKVAQENSWARTALLPTNRQAVALQIQEEKDAQSALSELRYEAQAGRHQAALDFAKIARDMILDGEQTPSSLFAMVKRARPNSPAHEKAAKDLLAFVTLTTNAKFPEGAVEVVKYAKALLASSGHSGGEQPSDDLRHVSQEQYEFWTKSPGQPTSAFVGPVESAGDPVNVINGRHKLFVTLDTLVDQTGKENWYGNGLLMSGDRVRTLARNPINWTGKTENVD